MQYDVLDMPGRGIGTNMVYSSRLRYNNPQPLKSQATVLREEEDPETGDTILRRVPQTTYPQPDSHYVIVRNAEEEIAWQIYAGPFDVTTAMEIAEALRTRADKE